jgi:hypothetical protein
MALSMKDEATSWLEQASPETLSKQPIKASKNPPKEKISEKDWSVLRGHLESNLAMLRTWRDSWWIQNYSDLARYILPRRSIWLTQSAGGIPSPNTMTRGLEINNNILDPTATFAARVCAGGIVSGLCSPSRPWFKLVPAMKETQLDDEARQWLDTVEDLVYRVLARSNWYSAITQEIEDLVVYGTSVNIIYEDAKDLIRCYTPCVGEYYLSSSATMRVEELNRVFVMTVSQMVDMFGLDNCSPDVQKLWSEKGGSLTTERLVAHSIAPNYAVGDQGSGVGRIKGDFAYREVFWMYGGGTKYPLSMRGYMESPFTATRWSTQSNDAYGRSPGMDILPDVIQLQVMTERKAEGVEKGLRPPLIANAELKNHPQSQLPGMVTYLNEVSAGKGMRSIYEQQFELNYITQDIAAIQQRIKVGLFNDLFMLIISGEPMTEKTATEITAKVSEKIAIIGPVIDNLLGGLQQKLQRVFAILQRKKMIAPKPKSLQGDPLDVSFISALAIAQKAANLTGAESLVKMAGGLAQLGKPEALDPLDVDFILRDYQSMLGVKEQYLHGPGFVAHVREQRAAQQQQQQKLAAMNSMADTASKGASAASDLSDVDVGSGQNAVQAMLGTQAGPGQRL